MARRKGLPIFPRLPRLYQEKLKAQWDGTLKWIEETEKNIRSAKK